MTTKTRQTTNGARLLREWLDRHDITIHKFCENNSLDYAWVHRVLSGERGQRVSVDFARSIERATGGDVAWDSWCSDTLRPADFDPNSVADEVA